MYLASGSLLILTVSSCEKEKQPDTADAPKAAEETIPDKETPPPVIESPDMEILRTKDYYTEENLKISDEVIAGLSPEIKEQVLDSMRGKRKIMAVKFLRENSETSLAVSKLTAERMAIKEGISAGF